MPVTRWLIPITRRRPSVVAVLLLCALFVSLFDAPAPVRAELDRGEAVQLSQLEANERWQAPAAQYDTAVPVAWFELAYELVQSERLSPPVAARLFGYAGVVLYEAVVPGMPAYQSLAGQLNELPEMPRATGKVYHWPLVANRALATVFQGLFEGSTSETQDAIAALEHQFTGAFAVEFPTGIVKRSTKQGDAVGQAILAWASRDGYEQLNNCAYRPPTGPGMWVPTAPAYAPALQPCWGQLRPFVLPAANVCEPGPPPAYSAAPSSPFYAEALEVYRTVNHLTPEQARIAAFWADNPGETGTPPGHSIAILTQILHQDAHSLAVAAEAYVKLGLGVADAFISCWSSKYTYHLLRPITYINTHIDLEADWSTPVITPPFPEYTSGHSVQSGATAHLLVALFGERPFTDHTHDARGFIPRSFSSFSALAREAALSRLYGGIHYRSAIERGLEQGTCVGQHVLTLAFRK